MKTTFLSLMLTLGLATSAFANPTPALDQLFPGYQPTVFDSYSAIDEIFQNDTKMPIGFTGASRIFGGGSQCFHRAEIWSYNLDHNYGVKTMKVFVFYTHQFKVAYKELKKKKFTWWFHVAPYTLLRNPATGQITEYVIDPTFAKTPLEMKPWTDMFVETNRKCAEFVPYEKFKNEVENGPNAVFGREHCYIVRTPATDFSPYDGGGLIERQAGLKSDYRWDYSQVALALDEAPISSNKKYYKQLLGF